MGRREWHRSIERGNANDRTVEILKCFFINDGEISAIINEEAFEDLDGPIIRITSLDTPVPFSPPQEEFFLPKVSDVVREVAKIAGLLKTLGLLPFKTLVTGLTRLYFVGHRRQSVSILQTRHSR